MGESKLEGLGGWLLLPIAGLLFAIYVGIDILKGGGLVLFMPELWSAFVTPGTPFYHSWWIALAVLMAFMQIGLIVASIAGLIAILLKKKIVAKLMIGIYALGALLMFLDYISTVFFLSTVSPDLARRIESESLEKFLGVSLGAAIWIPYFLKSKRVKNTFVR